MQQPMFKQCADSLRTFTNEKYDIKLKAAHAHELVAAYFGYPSKNAMLADTKFPLNNLNQAEIIVMTPDEFIDRRRKDLQGLSSALPVSYALGEAVYASLFSEESWASPHPPFRSFEKLAKFLIENSAAFHSAFPFYSDIPFQHVVDVKRIEDSVMLTVFHCYENSSGEMLGNGKTTINLPRVSGHIGYGKPQLLPEGWSGKFAQRTIEELLGAQS